MKGKRPLLALTVLLGALLAGQGTARAQFCSVSTTPVSFGIYDVFSPTPLASTGTVSYRCLLALGMTIWLSKGGAPTNDPRRMSNGSDDLKYNLYLDPAHTLIWGDPNPNAYDAGWPGLWTLHTVTIYGLIPAEQDVVAGTYTDTIVVTFQF